MEYRLVRFCKGVPMSINPFLTMRGAMRSFASARRDMLAGFIIMHDGLELQNKDGKTLLKFQK